MKKQEYTVYKWIYQHHKKAVYMMIVLVLVSSILSASFMVIAWLSKQLLDCFMQQQGNLNTLFVAIISIIVLQVILSMIINYFRTFIQIKIENKMRKHLLNGFYHTDYLTFQTYHVADYMTRLTNDVDIIADGIVSILPEFVSMLIQCIVGIWLLFVLNQQATYVIVIIGVIFLIGLTLFSKHFRYLHRDVKENRSQFRISMDEFLGNLVVIKAFQINQYLWNRISQRQHQYGQARMKQTLIHTGSSGCLYVFMILGYFLVLIWGAYQISIGVMTVGSLVAFLQIIDQLQKPLKGFNQLFTKYNSMMVSSERIMEIESLKKEKIEQQLDTNWNWNTLELSQVGYAYPDQTVLSNFYATIQKGEMTVFTGNSGIGKTTLFLLLLGILQQQQGTIVFNGEKECIPVGVNTRSLFAYVPQGNYLFHGTIRENLCCIESSINDQDIWNVLEMVCLKDQIMLLPKQLDTVLQQKGEGLSEGQKQRLAIARALLSDAEILLLDEATSALDEKTEKQVLYHLKHQSNKTLICISHRPEAIQICDQEIKITDKIAITETQGV